MPVQQQPQQRPAEHLKNALTLYPETGAAVDDFRASRGVDLPHWPDWCFMPMAAWYAIVSADARMNVLPPHLVADVARLAAIGTWRYSQGVYQMDPDMLQALVQSPVSGSIPSEVLYRLPEWSLYVETPGMSWIATPLHGFWTHLEWDANTGRTELRFLPDCDRGLIALPLHIGGDWTVTEAVDRAVAEAGAQASKIGLTLPSSPDAVQGLAQHINPLVSIVLYLCSEEPEVDDLREPGSSPNRPRPKKTKKGWRLFPPNKPRIWSVGTKTGAQLRQAQDAGDPTGRTMRTHLRRGHWHGFWTGPRQGQRKFVYRWLSPIIVAAPDE